MKQCLMICIALVFMLCVTSARSVVLAQALHVYCYNVDQGNLKLYQKHDLWTVQDITNGWDRNFRAKASAERFLAVLKSYEARVYCTKYIAGNNTLMSYMLADGNQPLSGSRVSGETCTTFEPALLKVVWSDETNNFILTDGSTVVVSVSFFRKGDLEDILSTTKKYNFAARCSVNHGTVDAIEYWKGKPTTVAVSREPIVTGRLKPINPRKEPLPKPAGMEEWESLGGNLGAGVGAVLQWAGREKRIYVFAKGVDGALWTRTSTDDVWTGWTSLGGAITSEPAAASFDSHTLVVVARGTDNAVWFRRLAGGKWEPWKSLGGSLRGAPAIASRGADRYQVFGVGDDRAIWQHSFDGTNPGTWVSLGRALKSLHGSDEIGFIYGPSAVSPSSQSTEIYAIGADSQLYGKKWFASCDCWSNVWESLGGDLTSTPSALLLGNGNVMVMARGRDQQLWKIIPTQYKTSSWKSLGGNLWSNPAAIRNGVDGFSVFGVASDNALWWRTFKE